MKRHYNDGQNGRGILNKVYDVNLRLRRPLNQDKLFPGEMHAILTKEDGKSYVANFMGPGTKLKQRLILGDQPLTEGDLIALAHDLRYSLAKRPEQIQEADKKMLNSLSKSTDLKSNINKAYYPMKAKYELEKRFGVKYPSKESLDKHDENDVMFKDKLAELEQKGYGIDPSAFLKVKLSDSMPVVNPVIQNLPTTNEHKTDYNKSEQLGQGMCKQKGGFLPFLVPFIPAILAGAKFAAAAMATGALGAVGSKLANKIMEGREKRQARRAARQAGNGLHIAGSGLHIAGGSMEDMSSMITNFQMKMSDFSNEALQKMKDIIEKYGTEETAWKVAEFLKPIIEEAVKAKLKSMMGAGMYGSGDGVVDKEEFVKVFTDNIKHGEGLRLAGPQQMRGSGFTDKINEAIRKTNTHIPYEELKHIEKIIKENAEIVNKSKDYWIQNTKNIISQFGKHIINNFLAKFNIDYRL